VNRLVQEGRLFWTGLSLLTRLPAPDLAGFQEEWLARSVRYFPLVGLIVGSLAAAVYRLGSLVWPDPLPAVLALATAAWVTGGLHEDGWADVFDGFAASREPRRILEVFKDSRVGAVGALALTFLVLGKLAGLMTLAVREVPAALVTAHVLSRWSSLPLLWRLAHARPEGGMAGPLAGRVRGGSLATGTAMAVLIVAVLLRERALPALAATAIATAAAGLFFRRRLGGITGDCLGATNQLVELAVLLALAARQRWAP
jgi:adenosylcobinamide-GDP ribazoletransferase